MANLLDFGIAVNFFGNYAKEGHTINDITDKIYNGFNKLQNIVIGAGITTALYKFGSSLMHTSQELEGVYATLLTVFGSKNRVLEHFKEAREFVAKNPILDLEQIHHATEQLALAGQAKTAKMTNTNLQYLGDFASGKNMNISDAIQAAVNAGNGNWEMLRNRGFDNRNLKTTAMSAHGTFTDEQGNTKEKSVELLKLADALAKAKVGTDEYKATVIKFLGIYEAGGMENASKTITGAMKAAHNLVNIFKMEIVGMTQEVGTLSNTIGQTLGKAVGLFSERMHKIETIGRGVGQILVGVWDMIDSAIESSSQTIVAWIDKLNEFFSDYKNNIAPIILFLFLVKLEIELFVSGFVDGFKFAFQFFVGAIIAVYKAFAELVSWLHLSNDASRSLGKVVGMVVGIMLGLKAFKFATQPFTPLINGAIMLYEELLKVRGLISMGEGWTLAESVQFRWMQFGDMMGKMITPLRALSASSWSFTASLLANPITLIVIAVIALVAWTAYLIYNWEETQKNMQGVSDTALLLLAVFLPMVGITMLIAKYWEQLKTIASNVWRGITGFAKAFWLTIKYEVLIPLQNVFSNVWNFVKKTAMGFFTYLLEKFPFLMVFVNAFKTAFMGVKEIFSSIWGFFEKIYDAVVNSDFIKSIVGFAESVSGMFGDAGDKAYEERLKEYEPEQYEKYMSEKNAKMYEKPTASTTNSKTETTQKEADTKYDFNGASINFNGVQNVPNMYGQLDNHAKSNGK